MQKGLILLLLVVVMTGCQSGSSEEAKTEAPAPIPAKGGAEAAGAPEAQFKLPGGKDIEPGGKL